MEEEEILRQAKEAVKKIAARGLISEKYKMWAELEELKRGDRSMVDTRIKKPNVSKDSDTK